MPVINAAPISPGELTEKFLANFKPVFRAPTLDNAIIQMTAILDFDPEEEDWQLTPDGVATLTRLYKQLTACGVTFDTENAGVVRRLGVVQHNDTAWVPCFAGGDWETPINFAIYWDGDALQVYFPTEYTAYNRKSMEAFGNGDDDDLYDLDEIIQHLIAAFPAFDVPGTMDDIRAMDPGYDWTKASLRDWAQEIDSFLSKDNQLNLAFRDYINGLIDGNEALPALTDTSGAAPVKFSAYELRIRELFTEHYPKVGMPDDHEVAPGLIAYDVTRSRAFTADFVQDLETQGLNIKVETVEPVHVHWTAPDGSKSMILKVSCEGGVMPIYAMYYLEGGKVRGYIPREANIYDPFGLTVIGADKRCKTDIAYTRALLKMVTGSETVVGQKIEHPVDLETLLNLHQQVGKTQDRTAMTVEIQEFLKTGVAKPFEAMEPPTPIKVKKASGRIGLARTEDWLRDNLNEVFENANPGQMFFQGWFDFEESFGNYLMLEPIGQTMNREAFKALDKDLTKVKFSVETVETIRFFTVNDIGFGVVAARDADGYPVLFVVYNDGEHFRAYIPKAGNTWNHATKAAFKDGEDDQVMVQYKVQTDSLKDFLETVIHDPAHQKAFENDVKRRVQPKPEAAQTRLVLHR